MSNRLNQEREAELQPERMKSCKEKLTEMGFVVGSNTSDMLQFNFKGHTVRFWPYSGWHTGKTIKDGRGFSHLVRQLEEPDLNG